MTDDRTPPVPGYFVTATDTGAGKTLIACALALALRARGLRVAAMKPVASGCRETPEGLRNEDAERLRAAASVECTYDEVNPFALRPAVAPHLAARAAGRHISVAAIVPAFAALARRADMVVVEGAGGWLVPLNARETMADLAAALALPVVLVVNMRLGCINHARLTAQAIRAAAPPLAGWIANCAAGAMDLLQDNVDAVAQGLGTPPWCVVPPLPAPDPRRVCDLLALQAMPPVTETGLERR